MDEKVELSLYVNGMNTTSNLIFAKLIKMCDEQFGDSYKLNLVDLRKEPEAGIKEKIIVLPTLVREYPRPEIRVTGDLTKIKKVMLTLELLPG